MPRIMQVIMVNTSVSRTLDWPMRIMACATLRAKPVMPQTPTMMPTQAQAIATETVDFAPATKASQMSLKLMRLMGRSSATRMVTTMVQNALKMTVLPLQMSI